MFRHQKKKKKQKKKLTSIRDKLEFQPRRCIKPRKKKSILPVEKGARDPSIFRTIDETATRWYPNGVKNSGNRHSRGSRWLEKSTLESGANRLSARFEHRYRIQIINHCRRCGVIERGTFSRRRSRGRSILIPRIESVRRLRRLDQPTQEFPSSLSTLHSFDHCSTLVLYLFSQKKRNERRIRPISTRRRPLPRFPALLLPLIEQPFQRLAKCTSSPTPLLFHSSLPGPSQAR